MYVLCSSLYFGDMYVQVTLIKMDLLTYLSVVIVLYTIDTVVPNIRTMTDRFDDMISGCLDNLPPKPPSEVRIFLSSTFSGMSISRLSNKRV